MSDNTLLDLEGMMNDTLDSVEVAPDFVTPPAGEYRLCVKDCKIDSYKTKEGMEASRLKITYTILETKSTLEGELPVPDGSIFSETFQGTTQGLSYFKKRIIELMNVEDVQGVSMRDMMDSVKGAEVDCRISIKKSPNPKGGFYENVNLRIIN